MCIRDSLQCLLLEEPRGHVGSVAETRSGSRLLHRILTSPAVTSMHGHHACAPQSPPAASAMRRCAELQQAHRTHACIEKAAAVAVPTPMTKNSPILQFLSTPTKHLENSGSSCMHVRAATFASDANTPFSQTSTPNHLKSPSAHAEQTLQVRPPPLHIATLMITL